MTPAVSPDETGASREDGNLANRRGNDSGLEDCGSFERWKEWKEWKEWRDWETWNARARAAGRQDAIVTEKSEDLGSESTLREPQTRFVLSGQPTGWAAMAEIVREFDEEKLKDCKEDIDTLLVFAGLYSAVLSAFIIVAFPSLQSTQQSSDQTIILLERIVANTMNYTTYAATLNATSPAATMSPSAPAGTPSATDILVNVLWFASLIISLISASFSILVKQWLREYLSVQNPSPQARLRVRHLRYPQLAKWKVFEIVAILPLLLQLALGLFFVGMCYFTSAIHSSIGYTTLPLVAGWAACVIGITLLPFIFPHCPYRTPLLKGIARSWFWGLLQVTLRAASFCASRFSSVHGALVRVVWYRTYRACRLLAQFLHTQDEDEATRIAIGDIEILSAVDAIQSNDELLRTTIAEAMHQIHPSNHHLRRFLVSVMRNRVPLPGGASDDWSGPVLGTYSSKLSLSSRSALIELLGLAKYDTDDVQEDLSVYDRSDRQTFLIMSLSLYGLDVGLQDVPHSVRTFLRHALCADGPFTCATLVRIIGRATTHPGRLSSEVSSIVRALVACIDITGADMERSVLHVKALLAAYALHSTDGHFPPQNTSYRAWLSGELVKPLGHQTPHGIPVAWCTIEIGRYLTTVMRFTISGHRDAPPSQNTLRSMCEVLEFMLHWHSADELIITADFSNALSVCLSNSVWGMDLVLGFVLNMGCEFLCNYQFIEALQLVEKEPSGMQGYARRPQDFEHVVLQRAASANRMGKLKLCLFVIAMVNDGAFRRRYELGWTRLLTSLSELILQDDSTVTTGPTVEEAALANASLSTIRGREMMYLAANEISNGWQNAVDDEKYSKWRSTTPSWDTFFSHELIATLAAFSPSWITFWRVRASQEEVATSSHLAGNASEELTSVASPPKMVTRAVQPSS